MLSFVFRLKLARESSTFFFVGQVVTSAAAAQWRRVMWHDSVGDGFGLSDTATVGNSCGSDGSIAL